jgi:hypothetical protein
MPTKAKSKSQVKPEPKEEPEILSYSEEMSLREEKQELEDTLRQAEEFGTGTPAAQMDKAALRRQIEGLDHAIASRQAPKISGKKIDSLVREARELEERFKQGLPTRYEMAHPAKCPGAVRKHMAWVARNEQYVNRYRYIQRLINPDDPKSIETLRKDK